MGVSNYLTHSVSSVPIGTWLLKLFGEVITATRASKVPLAAYLANLDELHLSVFILSRIRKISQ